MSRYHYDRAAYAASMNVDRCAAGCGRPVEPGGYHCAAHAADLENEMRPMSQGGRETAYAARMRKEQALRDAVALDRAHEEALAEDAVRAKPEEAERLALRPDPARLIMDAGFAALAGVRR